MDITVLITKVKQSRVASNTFYLMVLQVLNNILPLLTIPYLIRVLGADGFGVVAYSQVICTYITIISDYGFNLSATRQLAINRTETQQRNQLFTEVMLSKMLLLFLCLLFLVPAIWIFPALAANKTVYFFSIFWVLGQALFPVWFFQGMEDMKVIVWLNSVAKILFTGLIFLFIRNEDDISYVPLFNAIGVMLSAIMSLIIVFRKYQVKFSAFSISSFGKQLKDGFDVFIPSLFSSVINNGGVFVLGFFHSLAIVGIYSAVDKLVRAALNLFYPLSQALFPNISERLSTNYKEGVRFLKKVATFVVLGCLVGVVVGFWVAPYLLELLYGVDYRQYALLFNLLSLWAVISILNNFLGIQYLVGSGNGKIYRRAFLIAGVIIIMLFALIKPYAVNGIIGAMLGGEIILTILMLFYIKRINYTGEGK